MPCSYQFIDDGAILLHLNEGVVTLSEIGDLVRETKELLQGRLVEGVLVDAQNVDSGPDKAEVLLWIKSQPAVPVFGKKTALLANEALADVFEFISLALQHRGAVVREFTSEEEALSWLRTPEEQDPLSGL